MNRHSLRITVRTLVAGVLASLVFAVSPLGGATADAQTPLDVSGTGTQVDLPPATCVRLTQDGEWVSEPVLAHPLLPIVNSDRVAWGAFAGLSVLLYFVAFVLFQTRVRGGASPLSSFGRAFLFFVLAVGASGYLLTGHLSYAKNWCVDASGASTPGAAPARTNAEVEGEFGVGINEIIDRGTIPLEAHARLTPWYFWLAGTGVLAAVFFFGFRSPNAPGSESSSGRATREASQPEKW